MPVTVEELYERLEDREASRRKINLPDAREVIARTLKLSVGTLSNLKARRLKRVEHLREVMNEALIRSIEAEIARLTHEVEILRCAGERPDSDKILQAETLLARARELIGGTNV